MPRYVWINPERLKKAQDRTRFDGLELIVELSPYDVPKSVAGEYDRGTGRFLISLEYIDEEPGKLLQVGDGIEVTEGKYSGKLLRMAIPVDKPHLDKTAFIALRTRIEDVLDKIEDQPRQGRANHAVAKRVIEEDLPILAGDLVAS